MPIAENFDLTGVGSLEEVQELQKALTAGSGIVSDGTTGGAALRIQSLEGNLKRLSFDNKHLIMWNMIPKKKAKSVAEEFTREIDPGQGGDPFIQEIATPYVVNSEFEREVAQVKYMGITGEVSLAMGLVNNITPAEAIEINNKSKALMRGAEFALFEGDPTKNPLSFTGIGPAVESWVSANSADADNVIDMRGNPLTPETLEDACATIAMRFGDATHAFLPTPVFSDLAKQMYDHQRWVRGSDRDKAHQDRLGIRFREFDSQSGDILALYQHKLLNYRIACPTTALGTQAPATPSVAKSAISDSDTQLAADTYYYKVAAVGSGGQSAPCSAQTQAATTGQSVQLVITNPANTTYFKIFRSDDNSDFYLLDTIAADGSGSTTFVDAGANIAGCSNAYIMDMDDDQVLAFHRLADMMKVDLATVGTAKRFMVLLYGTPVFYNPRKIVKVKNIGRYTPS